MVVVDKHLKDLIDQKILSINVGDENPPFNPLEQIGPSSIDLRLGRVFRRYKSEANIIDLTQIQLISMEKKKLKLLSYL